MTRLGAFDALSRGIANVRANPWVILVAFLATLVTVVVAIASALPWLGLLGLEPGDLVGAPRSPVDPGVLFERLRLLFSPGELMAKFWIGLLSFTVGLTAASLIYAWSWGGILGVLSAGDAQAPPGTGRPPMLFRTWSPRLLVGEGHRLAIRLLLVWCVLQLTALVLLVLVGAAVALGVAFGARHGMGAGFAVGCGAVIPVALLLIVVAMGGWLSKLQVVDPRHGVGSAIRAGFELLGRRLGAALVLSLLFFVLSIASSMAISVSTTLLQLVTMTSTAASGLVLALVLLLQWLAAAALSVTFNAAGIALVRSERALESAAE